MSTFFLFFALLVGASAQNLTEIETCDDFGDSVSQTSYGDVTVSMYPFADILCPNHTTFNMSSGNKLTIVSTDNVENFYGYSNFVNVRVNINNGSSLTIENNVLFENPNEDFRGLPDVNGGILNIGVDSEVRFLNDFKTKYIGVRSQTEESSDFANHQNSGGVVFNQGKLVVEKLSEFEKCENSGGGESSPGPGGCVYNEGLILFKGGVKMSDVSILDDEGNNGAGIYNTGSVRVSGNSKFTRMFAETAGAIYNAEGSLFVFQKGASVLFNECKASDGVAGMVFNDGYMKFTGPALFVEGRSYNQGGAIVIGDTGTMKLSKDAVFFGTTSGDVGSPVYVRSGGVFDYKRKKTVFIQNTAEYPGDDEGCFSIYDENVGECLE